MLEITIKLGPNGDAWSYLEWDHKMPDIDAAEILAFATREDAEDHMHAVWGYEGQDARVERTDNVTRMVIA